MEIDVGTIIRLKSKRDAAGPVSEKETSPIQTEEHTFVMKNARRTRPSANTKPEAAS